MSEGVQDNRSNLRATSGGVIAIRNLAAKNRFDPSRTAAPYKYNQIYTFCCFIFPFSFLYIFFLNFSNFSFLILNLNFLFFRLGCMGAVEGESFFLLYFFSQKQG